MQDQVEGIAGFAALRTATEDYLYRVRQIALAQCLAAAERAEAA